jgi:hypothetical protein
MRLSFRFQCLRIFFQCMIIKVNNTATQATEITTRACFLAILESFPFLFPFVGKPRADFIDVCRGKEKAQRRKYGIH